MNKKELRELKKRLNLEYGNIPKIYGCYVSNSKQILSQMELSTTLLQNEEIEMYFKILKKVLSGRLGSNLLDIEFSTKQVEDSDEHRLLQALRQSHLKDENMRNLFYERIMENVELGETNYVILLASDSYDVPFKGTDDIFDEDESSEVFDYFICCLCPVKDAKAMLQYDASEKSFKGMSTGHTLGAPELGFMFPAFDDRAANIYNALYYTRSLSDVHQDFIDTVFNIDSTTMSASEQKYAFGGSLENALGSDCSFQVVRSLHNEIRERLQIHTENKEPEAPEIYVEDVDDTLRKAGVPEEKIESFNKKCSGYFDGKATLNPMNLMDSKKFRMETPEVKINVDPEYTYAIETKVIDGQKYIMIPVSGSVTVNGIDIEIMD